VTPYLVGRSLEEMQARQDISAGRDAFKQLTAHLQAVGLAVRWVAVPAARPGERGSMYAGGDRCFEWSCYNASRLVSLMLREYEAIARRPHRGKEHRSHTQPLHFRKMISAVLNGTRLSSTRVAAAEGGM